MILAGIEYKEIPSRGWDFCAAIQGGILPIQLFTVSGAAWSLNSLKGQSFRQSFVQIGPVLLKSGFIYGKYA
jgi:hypothetical protein